MNDLTNKNGCCAYIHAHWPCYNSVCSETVYSLAQSLTMSGYFGKSFPNYLVLLYQDLGWRRVLTVVSHTYLYTCTHMYVYIISIHIHMSTLNEDILQSEDGWQFLVLLVVRNHTHRDRCLGICTKYTKLVGSGVIHGCIPLLTVRDLVVQNAFRSDELIPWKSNHTLTDSYRKAVLLTICSWSNSRKGGKRDELHMYMYTCQINK